jgi:hypothetical protein
MMASMNSNIWGLIAMPLGVLLCFGPALFAWVKAECQSEPPDNRRNTRSNELK